MARSQVRLQLTRASLEGAIALKESGLTWKRVGQRLGMNPAALREAAVKHQRGLYQFQYEKASQECAKYLEMMLDGSDLVQVAAKYGTFKSRVYLVLAREGWDRETIREERELRSGCRQPLSSAA